MIAGAAELPTLAHATRSYLPFVSLGDYTRNDSDEDKIGSIVDITFVGITKAHMIRERLLPRLSQVLDYIV